MRRATPISELRVTSNTHFYPRSPCGERPKTHQWPDESHYFYPRSPCGERLRGEHHANSQQEFLSTLSLRRATAKSYYFACPFLISIHALLAESDQTDRSTTKPNFNFYPRSPCGERQPSTTRRLTNIIISIHALLAESDPKQLSHHKSNR